MEDGEDFIAGGAPPETECVDAVGEEMFAGGGDDFGFALGRCEDQAASHAVAAEDPSGGAAGEEQFFCVDDTDELALLIADDDARAAAIRDAGQEVVGQGGGVLVMQSVAGERADGRCDAVEFVLRFDQGGLEQCESHGCLVAWCPTVSRTDESEQGFDGSGPLPAHALLSTRRWPTGGMSHFGTRGGRARASASGEYTRLDGMSREKLWVGA